MIKRKTVLVLGAGASKPYGLLLGSELTNTLCTWAWNPPDQNTPLVSLLEQCGHTRIELIEFCRAFHRSLVPSVDAFLEHRPVMAPIGKLLIAYLLGGLESNNDDRWFVEEDHWYRYLWNRMREYCDSAQAIPNNRLRIITFNYDRSLEYALYRAIRHTFGAEDADAQQILARLKIEHVYGQLGPFHYLGLTANGRFYTPITDVRELTMAAAGIRTIPESRADGKLFEELREWFYWADEVAFMGFAFDKINIERLGFSSVLDVKRERVEQRTPNLAMPRIFACTFGLTEVEAEAARVRTCGGTGWTAVRAANLAFLRSIDFLS